LPEIQNKTRRADIRWFGFDGSRAVHLISVGVDPPPIRPLATHFALASSNFDATLRVLNEKGVIFEDLSGQGGQIAIRTDGIRQIYFKDPDNYWIEINEAPQ
jgi:lactoylglutathione lyase